MASLDKYKLTQNTWDSDVHPERLLLFVTNMGSMVRAILHGPILEDYITIKIGRNTRSHVTTPSFLALDPDFAPPLDSTKSEEDGDASVSNIPSGSADDDSSSINPSAAVSHSMGSQTLNVAGSYYELSQEARDLDSLLYNVLRMCVKGAKSVLLECVQFPSYVQGIIVLMRHHDISRNDRVTQAFIAMDQLNYNGDVCAWQAQTVQAVRELYDSGATIMHFVLTRILKSFNGKLTTIQYRIAEDINQRIIDDNTNIYDMVQKYAVEIASVGASKTNVNMAREENSDTSGMECTYCHKKNHSVDKCYKRKKAEGKPEVETRTCHECGQKGHIRPDCPNKSNKASNVHHVVQPPAEPNAFPTNDGQNAKDSQLRGDLAEMLERLQQQHVSFLYDQHVSKYCQSSSLFSSEQTSQAIRTTLPDKSVPVSDIEVFVRNSDGSVTDRLNSCSMKCTRYSPEDFGSRTDFYNWLMDCTCGCDGSCLNCNLCQGCCRCHSADNLPATVAGGWGNRGNAHIGEASHPGPIGIHPCCRTECPCPSSYNGQPGKHCCDTCRFEKACSGAWHTAPSKPVLVHAVPSKPARIHKNSQSPSPGQQARLDHERLNQGDLLDELTICVVLPVLAILAVLTSLVVLAVLAVFDVLAMLACL